MTRTDPKIFIDTNILVYAQDLNEPDKKRQAEIAITGLSEIPYISGQVLKEIFSSLKKKLKMHDDIARQLVRVYFKYNFVPETAETIRKTFEIQQRYKLSIWDAGVIASAIAARADVLWSEDLQAGLVIEGVRVVNPLA